MCLHCDNHSTPGGERCCTNCCVVTCCVQSKHALCGRVGNVGEGACRCMLVGLQQVSPQQSYVTYIMGRTKPAGSPMVCSPDTLLTTRGLDGTMVYEIAVNTCSFVLIFCILTIYEYTSLVPRLQTSRACNAHPAESEPGIDDQKSSSHDCCRIRISFIIDISVAPNYIYSI